MYNLIIVGSGPAGYTAAIYAARAGLNPLMLAGPEPGGQLTLTTDVENYPGFAQGILGPDLMEAMKAQSQAMGAELKYETVEQVRAVNMGTQNSSFTCHTAAGVYEAKAIIIATGASARWLNLPSEKKYRGFGISTCATCDGPLPVFRGATLAVIGGGNSAVEEALFLTRYAKKVYLIHRRDTLRAERILQERLIQHEKIEILWNYTVKEFVGIEENSPTLTGLKLASTVNHGDKEIQARGAFVAIGHIPNTNIFSDLINVDAQGYILGEGSKTSCPGIFKAGDVGDNKYRQAITAAGMGCMAALDAQSYLDHWGI